MSWNDINPRHRQLAEQHLTPRQLQVLKLRLDGHSWRTIGRSLGISEATVRGHHQRALDNLATHAHTDTEAA